MGELLEFTEFLADGGGAGKSLSQHHHHHILFAVKII